MQVSQSIRHIQRHLQQLHQAHFRHHFLAVAQALYVLLIDCLSQQGKAYFACHDNHGRSHLRIWHASGGHGPLLVAVQVVEQGACIGKLFHNADVGRRQAGAQEADDPLMLQPTQDLNLQVHALLLKQHAGKQIPTQSRAMRAEIDVFGLTGRSQCLIRAFLPAAAHGLTSCRKLSSSPAWSPCEASLTFTATAMPFHVAAITQALVWLQLAKMMRLQGHACA